MEEEEGESLVWAAMTIIDIQPGIEECQTQAIEKPMKCMQTARNVALMWGKSGREDPDQ